MCTLIAFVKSEGHRLDSQSDLLSNWKRYLEKMRVAVQERMRPLDRVEFEELTRLQVLEQLINEG